MKFFKLDLIKTILGALFIGIKKNLTEITIDGFFVNFFVNFRTDFLKNFFVMFICLIYFLIHFHL